MGATLKHAAGTSGKSLAKRLQAIRNACSRHSVVAGYIPGLSSAKACHKAYQNEHGFTSTDLELDVPPRPFVYTSVPLMAEGVRLIARTIDLSRPVVFFREAGELMANCIRTRIDAGGFAENTEYTKARKQGTEPLVDSGEMYQEAKFKVRAAE